MQIRPQGNHLTPVRMAIIFFFLKKRKNSVGKGVEKLKHLCTVCRNVKWWSHCGKQYGVSFKNRTTI